jgi:hypothetical protein
VSIPRYTMPLERIGIQESIVSIVFIVVLLAV